MSKSKFTDEQKMVLDQIRERDGNLGYVHAAGFLAGYGDGLPDDLEQLRLFPRGGPLLDPRRLN